MNEIKRGTQIIYLPAHAKGDPEHPAAEPGFVNHLHSDGQSAWVHYWSKDDPRALVTKGNAIRTATTGLVVKDTRPQAVIDQAIEILDRQKRQILDSDTRRDNLKHRFQIEWDTFEQGQVQK